jgi:hypothetical protein
MVTQACGFITIVAGTFLLHTTKDMDLTVQDLDQLTRSHEEATGMGTGAQPSSNSTAALRGRRPVTAALVEIVSREGSGKGERGGVFGKTAEGVRDGGELGDREEDALLGGSGSNLRKGAYN